jgi:hypothetical protein
MGWFTPATALLVRRTVIVHTKDGRSFAGVLGALFPGEVVLFHARMLPDGSTIAGDVVLPRGNISFVQQNVPDPFVSQEGDQ